MKCIQPGVPMFSSKWLQDNRVIAGMFGVCALLNALAMTNGYYR